LIGDFAASRGGEVLARFTRVERGRKEERPEQSKIMHRAKVSGTNLVIAKLDRLSRNAAFRLAPSDSRGRIVAVKMLEENAEAFAANLAPGQSACLTW
jgi:hypothetical protein